MLKSVHYSIYSHEEEDENYFKDQLISEGEIKVKFIPTPNPDYPDISLDSALKACLKIYPDFCYESWKIFPPRSDSQDIWVHDTLNEVVIRFEVEYGMI